MAILTNILLVSIPEEICVFLLSLIYMGRSDLVRFSKSNILKLLVISAVTAAASNLIKLFSYIHFAVLPVIFLTLMVGLAILLYRFFSLSQVARCILGIFLGYITVCIVQMLYVPLLFSCTDITLQDLNTPGPIIIWLSLPERLVEITLIVMLLVKKKITYKINPMKLVIRDRVTFILISLFFLFNILFIYLMIEAVYVYGMLRVLPLVFQGTIVLFIGLLPFFNIFILFYVIYWLIYTERVKTNFLRDESRVFSVLIRTLIKKGRLTDALEEVNEFEAENRKFLNTKNKKKGELV